MTAIDPAARARELIGVVAEALGADAATLTLASGRSTVAGWDSLAHLRIVLEVESHFRIRLPVERVWGVQTIGDFAAFIG